MKLMSRFNGRIQTRDNSWHVVSTDIIGNDIMSKRHVDPYEKNNTFFLLHFAGAFLERFTSEKFSRFTFDPTVAKVSTHKTTYLPDTMSTQCFDHTYQYNCNSSHLNSTCVDAAACSCQRKEAASEREIRHFFIDRFVTYIQERLNLQTQEKNTSLVTENVKGESDETVTSWMSRLSRPVVMSKTESYQSRCSSRRDFLSCLYDQTSILSHWGSSSFHSFHRNHVSGSQNSFFTFWPRRNCQRCPPDSRSECFRFYSCHFKMKIFQRLRTRYQLDKRSYLRLLMSTLCSSWPYLLFPDSLILIRYETLPRNIRRARSILMFMCLTIVSLESMIIDQKQCSLQQKICIWSDYYRPLIYS